jgi:hypothetical protein
MSDQTKPFEVDAPSAAPELERRRATRYPCSLQPAWRVLGSRAGDSWMAVVRDISTTGISMVIKYQIKPGTVLVIRLQSTNRRLSRPLPVRVMHATAQTGGHWLIGCDFVRRLSDNDLEDLLREDTGNSEA